ncbi:jg15948 [Pararge aegeria aegeria]|uniref:Jg15948 protein n=1 Tax=Pararge aegeria aegeria TaxID=348720 RepID=A0A8S4S2X3_9NEOP|nr:jg15948 [Pararge aegeria aegeria]
MPRSPPTMRRVYAVVHTGSVRIDGLDTALRILWRPFRHSGFSTVFSFTKASDILITKNAHNLEKESTHVLSEDTCSRQVKDGCLYTKRLLTKTNRVPKWGERFFSAKSVKIIEESIVDPERKVLITYTRNLGYTKVMSVVERVEYRPAGPGQTIAKRSAWIDSQVFGFSRAIRAFGLDRFRKNCNQMVSGAGSSSSHRINLKFKNSKFIYYK